MRLSICLSIVRPPINFAATSCCAHRTQRWPSSTLSTHCCDSMNTSSANVPGSRELTFMGDVDEKRSGLKRSSSVNCMCAGVTPMAPARPRSSGGTGLSLNFLLIERCTVPSSVSWSCTSRIWFSMFAQNSPNARSMRSLV